MILYRLNALLLVLILCGGCSGLLGKNKGKIGKESQKTAAIAEKINELEQKSSNINEQRLTSIGAWSDGVDYSLQKETNKSPAVSIAQDLNERIAALANKPDFEEVKAIHKIIDTLITNQINGEKLLVSKDKEITSLTKAIEKIETDTEKQIKKAFEMSEVNAAHADQYKATLSAMDSFFGGGAIWYGLKKLVTKLAWFIGGGLLLYVLLRIASNFHPIAAAAFSIVNTIFGIIIKMVQGVAPKAAQMAGFIETRVFNEYKGTLTHVIDAVQMMKEKEKLGVDITMDMLMNEISKTVDSKADEDRIDEIKKNLNWK